MPAVELVPVVGGLSQPVLVTHDGTGSGVLYIVEQGGLIGAGARRDGRNEFADLRGKIATGGERGLLGLAFSPQQDAAHRFYVVYTRASDGAIVIAEYSAAGGEFSERVLLTTPHPNNNHNGGMMAFGADGMLYVALGDSGSANDPPDNAQNRDSLLGKVLRIDPTGTNAGAYGIPPDNPFVGVAGTRPEIWALGFRNPWRFSFDRGSGQLWLGDVGQANREEVDVVVRGGNFGWRVFKGTFFTGLGPAPCDGSQFVAPLAEYVTHSGPSRCAVTGGYVYRGAAATLPTGSYLYGDYCSGELFLYEPGAPQQVLADTPLNISSFGERGDGELLVVDLNGSVYRVARRTTQPDPCARPRGPLSGPTYDLGAALGATGAGLRQFARDLCRQGL